MRSAGFWAGTAGIMFAAVVASAPSLAQYVPAPVDTAKIGNAAAVANATQPGAPAKPAAKPAQAKPAQVAAAPAAANAHPVTAHTSNAPQVFLLKGLADVFSSGLDKLADRLRGRGVNGQVASHAQWDTLADKTIERYRAGQRGPIVVAGHSLGADAAVDFANRLYAAKVPVALVITFGPLQFRPVMGNVARAVNYYQANSAWHGQILRGKDFKGQLANIALDNAADVNHFNIEKVDRIQIEAVNRIVGAIGGGGGPKKAPVPPAATATAGEGAPATTSATPEQKPADGTAAAGAGTGEAAPAKAN